MVIDRIGTHKSREKEIKIVNTFILVTLLLANFAYSSPKIELHDKEKSGDFEIWAKKNIFQNSTKTTSTVEYDGFQVAVPSKWYAWATQNADVRALKVSQHPVDTMSNGITIFLNEREWPEASLKSAMNKMKSANQYSQQSLEKWNDREWLMSREIKDGNIEISVRTITAKKKFK